MLEENAFLPFLEKAFDVVVLDETYTKVHVPTWTSEKEDLVLG
jgi:hypothetical protein